MFFPMKAVPMGIAGKMGSSSTGGAATGSKASSGGAIVIANPHHADTGLPKWAWIIIGVGSFVVALFIAAFVFHIIHERRTARKQNRSPSIGRAIWKAIEIALFIWIFTSLAKLICGRKRKAGSTSYRKVDNAGEMTANNNIFSSSHGFGSSQPGPSGAAYGDGGSGQRDMISEKYEPMGYTSSTTAVSVGAGERSPRGGNVANPPYSPNSAFDNASTAYAPTTTYAPGSEPLMPSTAGGPVHITPDTTPLPTPAANTPFNPPSASATYVPSHDSRPMY